MKEARQEAPRPRGRALRTVGTFALGAAAGGIIALLFAPASGKVTRKRIGMKVKALQKAATVKLTQAQRVLARKAVGLRDVAAERIHNAQEWVVDHMPTNGHAKRPSRRTAYHA